MISVILLKSANIRDFHLSFFQMVIEWRDFSVVTKLVKNCKSLYSFGGRYLNIRDVCMDFEPCFEVHNLVSVHPKSVKLGQITSLNAIFYVLVSVYRFVKIWNSLPVLCAISEWPIKAGVNMNRCEIWSDIKKEIVRIKMGWKHYQSLLILHFKFQFSKSIKSSTFHIFLNLTYPLRQNISFPKCPKITQKFTQNRQTVVNEISREI